MTAACDAVVIGATGGIGGALAEALLQKGHRVRRFGRSLSGEDHLDLTDEVTIRRAASSSGSPALVLIATGLLHDAARGPEKSLEQLDVGWLCEQFAVNAIGPALVAKHFLPIMPREGRTVFAVLSARVGSISDNRLGGWYGYRASKAALNQFVRSAAIEHARRNTNAVVVALHPGTVDTALSRPFGGGVRERFAPDCAARQLLEVVDRLHPQQSGRLFAWDGEEIAP